MSDVNHQPISTVFVEVSKRSVYNNMAGIYVCKCSPMCKYLHVQYMVLHIHVPDGSLVTF